MKIALVGATGNSGLQLLQQGCERGHQVTALVRSPEKLASFANNANLKIVKCNIMDPNELASHLAGHDCVLSALGAPGIQFSRVTLYTESMKSIVEAMRKSNLKRLICITAFYTKPDSNYPFTYKFILRPMIGRQLDNMLEMEEYLTKDCQDLDFSIVRPPRLTDDPLSDKTIMESEDAYFFPNSKATNITPRANVAKFMLDILDSNKYLKKAVAINLPA